MKTSQKHALRRALHYRLLDKQKEYHTLNAKANETFTLSIKHLSDALTTAEKPCADAWYAEQKRLNAQYTEARIALADKYEKLTDRRKKQIFATSAALRKKYNAAKAKHKIAMDKMKAKFDNAFHYDRLMTDFDIELEFANTSNVDQLLTDFLRKYGL